MNKLLNLNKLLGAERVEVILLSRNSADTGLRVFNSIRHYGLNITRAAFCGGDSPYRYIAAFNSHLFLSTDGGDVRHALELGIAAATILPSTVTASTEGKLKFAFDGDAVLFSDEAERIYKASGLQAFTESEKLAANRPLSGGPFKPFLAALQQLKLTKVKAAVIGTTGLTQVQELEIAEHARRIAIVRDRNFSLGVNLMIGLVEQVDRKSVV